MPGGSRWLNQRPCIKDLQLAALHRRVSGAVATNLSTWKTLQMKLNLLLLVEQERRGRAFIFSAYSEELIRVDSTCH